MQWSHLAGYPKTSPMADYPQELKDMMNGFTYLYEADRNFIMQHTTIEVFPKGSWLLREGQVARHCYAILKGCVRKYYIKNGVEHTTAFFTEGMPVVAFTSQTNQTPSDHYLECTEECMVTVSNPEHEAWMCEQLPNLEKFIRIEVEKNNGKDQEAFTRFMTSTPEERYLALLEERPDLLNRVPQHQIASYIGVKPESLSRIRKRMLHRSH